MVDNSRVEEKQMIKLIIVGDQGVGKTQILKKFINKPRNGSPDKRESATIGVEFTSKEIQLNSREKVKLQIWDTAGQERFRAITSAYYRRALGAIIVYDVTEKRSFDNLNKWIDEIKYYADEDIEILIIGNKIDQQQKRQVQDNQLEEFALKGNFLFKETSAVDDKDQLIQECFYSLIEKINEKQKEKMVISEQNNQGNIAINQQPEDPENKPCC